MTSEPQRKNTLLAALSPEERESINEFLRPRPFEKDDNILKEGEYNDSLFIVTAGLLHARLHVDDGHTLLTRLEPGTFFGEISVFDPGKTTANVVAITKGELLEMRRDQLLEFVEQHPAAGAKMLLRLTQEIARRVRASDDRLGDALLLNRLISD